MVVADLVVGDDARQRQHVEALDVRRGGLVLAPRDADVAGDRLELGDHVARQVARARTRIREHLVLLVAALRGRERAARGEAEAAVGLALQRREVVEQRRALLALLRLELRDLADLAAHGRDDGVGGLGGRQPRLRAVVVAALVDALAGRGEDGVDEPVRLGHERADLLLAAREDRERRRLHAAERHRAVKRRAQADRRGARRVHADDPVGLRARAGRGLQRRELRTPGAAR